MMEYKLRERWYLAFLVMAEVLEIALFVQRNCTIAMTIVYNLPRKTTLCCIEYLAHCILKVVAKILKI